ncbi:hypothetical protein [Nocardia goodfellowii]|uniref:HPr kinase n=1 Tax=Nocardia goodfellowii TaxID=882446 RepID=A0ABS4QDB0_9NOCA|nr:hypothetical protein [Nocardia goodfellowii]MBP2189674.1 hypothetical protein [Nocardia goodfellowii]
MKSSQLAALTPVGATTRQLSIRSHLVQIVTTATGAAGLVSETFYPPGMLSVFEAIDEQQPELTIVDLACDATEIVELLETAATGTHGEYELTRNYRLPRFDGDGYTVFALRDVNSDEVAALIRTDRRITIVRPRTNLGDRWLTRVIRDIATRYAKADGALVLHSSAFVFGGRAYLVIGDSGAGKSTTAIALARLLPEGGWMGNDRMHLDLSNDHYRVTACPLPLAINKGSLDVMGVTDFHEWSVRAGFPHPGSDWDKFNGEDKLKLSSLEVKRYLDVPVVPEAELAGVILPRVDRAADYFCEPAKPDQVAGIVERNCFSLDDNLYGEDWLEISGTSHIAPPSIHEFLDHIAILPVLSCSIGNADHVARLLVDFQRAVRV